MIRVAPEVAKAGVKYEQVGKRGREKEARPIPAREEWGSRLAVGFRLFPAVLAPGLRIDDLFPLI